MGIDLKKRNIHLQPKANNPILYYIYDTDVVCLCEQPAELIQNKLGLVLNEALSRPEPNKETHYISQKNQRFFIECHPSA